MIDKGLKLIFEAHRKHHRHVDTCKYFSDSEFEKKIFFLAKFPILRNISNYSHNHL